jgi:hypothetical protein
VGGGKATTHTGGGVVARSAAKAVKKFGCFSFGILGSFGLISLVYQIVQYFFFSQQINQQYFSS